MQRAGTYRTRLDWLKRTTGTRDGYGQRADTFPSQGYLWGGIQDVSGGRESRKESERQVTTAVIRLRNFPAVAAGDRLTDTNTGEVWSVLTAVPLWQDNETYCEVERPHWSASGGAA